MITNDDIYWAKDKVIQLRRQLEDAEHRVRDLENQKQEEERRNEDREREERNRAA